MMLAATFAGMGFGNSGVHIPHANAYPIAGMVKDYRPPNYPQSEPMVPHGISVSLTAPEAFRFSFPSAPERHLRAAALRGRPGERAVRRTMSRRRDLRRERREPMWLHHAVRLQSGPGVRRWLSTGNDLHGAGTGVHVRAAASVRLRRRDRGGLQRQLSRGHVVSHGTRIEGAVVCVSERLSS